VQEEGEVTYNELERLRKENELEEVMLKFSPLLEGVSEKFP
jgi:hypothetical protein